MSKKTFIILFGLMLATVASNAQEVVWNAQISGTEHDAVRRTLHTATLDASLCDQCGKCVEVCSQNAIVILTAVQSASWGKIKRLFK
jgi:ferredoxin